jgi:hypothetical protein
VHPQGLPVMYVNIVLHVYLFYFSFLLMYYLDNLDCEQKMRCVEVPHAKLFGKEMIQKLVKADKKEKDGLTIFGNLNVSIFSSNVVYITLTVTPRFSNCTCSSNVVYSLHPKL